MKSSSLSKPLALSSYLTFVKHQAISKNTKALSFPPVAHLAPSYGEQAAAGHNGWASQWQDLANQQKLNEHLQPKGTRMCAKDCCFSFN